MEPLTEGGRLHEESDDDPAAILLWMGVIAAHGATAGETSRRFSFLRACPRCTNRCVSTTQSMFRWQAMRGLSPPAPLVADSNLFGVPSVRPLRLQKERFCRQTLALPGLSLGVREARKHGQPSLKVAYHQACLKCHWGDVGSAGKNLEGCTEMCHVLKVSGNREKKK